MQMHMRTGAGSIAILIFGMAMAGTTRAQAPWPGETWKNSKNLTALASADWQSNLSGAFWNPLKRQLWVVNNSGMFHKLVEGGPLGFMIDTTGGKPGKWNCGGDAEGITQAGLDENSVIVMNEDDYIEEYSTLTNGLVKKVHSWDIRSIAAAPTIPRCMSAPMRPPVMRAPILPSTDPSEPCISGIIPATIPLKPFISHPKMPAAASGPCRP